MTDRLTLTRAFEEGEIKRDAAERIATAIYDAIHETVATKADVAAVRADMMAMEERLNHKIDTMVNRLVAAMVVALTILFGAMHQWPPHG